MNHIEFASWSQARIDECTAQQHRLQAEGRGDEAAFMQIRANVYGIFLTVCRALNGDMDAVRVRLNAIPASWVKSLTEAESHGDMHKAHIERIKLDAVAHIRRALEGEA